MQPTRDRDCADQRTAVRRRRGRIGVFGLFGLLLAALAGCEGDGSDGASPRVQRFSDVCLPVGGSFPPGLVMLPGTSDEAAVVQPGPGNVLGLQLRNDPPSILTSGAVPSLPRVPESCSERCGPNPATDSDGDGVTDRCNSFLRGFTCQSSVPGSLLAVRRDLVFLSNSSYEQILAFDPQTSRLSPLEIETPAASATFDPEDWPFWPLPGAPVLRTGLSTRACVYTDQPDSLGDPVGISPFCDPGRNGFATSFTAGSAVAAGRLFVATSNLRSPGRTPRYQPGTLLVFDFDDSVNPPRIQPSPDRAALFTTGFNPTAVRAYTTPTGRELVLVAVSGAISLDRLAEPSLTDAFVDVFDANTTERVATIPLGRAGLGPASIEIDASGRIALLGAFTRRFVYAVDLAPLDDPRLGTPGAPPSVRLNGSEPGFPDARVYTADAPFELRRRADGPSILECDGPSTSVAISASEGNAVAVEFCDGTLTVMDIALPADRTLPLDPAQVLSINRVENAAAPLVASSAGENRAPYRVQFRNGRPGIDFDGPDVYFVIGQTEGAVCSLRVNAL